MADKQFSTTWEQLMQSLNNTSRHPDFTVWDIYRYMNENLASMTSEEARTLLTIYMKIPLQRPSHIHSRMLAIAVRMAGKYPDFRFGKFLKLWGYPRLLLDADKERAQGKDGRYYPSLKERTERALQSYLLHHPEERDANEMSCIQHVVAVRVFDSAQNGRMVKLVKLVSAAGDEYLSSISLFPCNPGNVLNNVFDALIRYSKEGTARIQEIVLSEKTIEEVLPKIAGYVEYVDEYRKQYHVYDSGSRHLVAVNPKMEVRVGDFVEFIPIVPKESKFKSAVIVGVLSKSDGIKAFGVRRCLVTYTDKEKGYAAWELTSAAAAPAAPPIIEVGTQEPAFTKGYISARSMNMSHEALPQKDEELNIVVFLKRGKDKSKHPHVVYFERIMRS